MNPIHKKGTTMSTSRIESLLFAAVQAVLFTGTLLLAAQILAAV